MAKICIYVAVTYTLWCILNSLVIFEVNYPLNLEPYTLLLLYVVDKESYSNEDVTGIWSSIKHAEPIVLLAVKVSLTYLI